MKKISDSDDHEMYNLVLIAQLAKDILHLNALQSAWHIKAEQRVNRQLFCVVLVGESRTVHLSEERKRASIYHRVHRLKFMHSHYCSLISLFPLLKSVDVIMWTPLQVSSTQLLQTFYFFILLPSLGFVSLSVLHTCEAGECGSLRDDSSVAHLIAAWPYLGCPEIHFSALV